MAAEPAPRRKSAVRRIGWKVLRTVLLSYLAIALVACVFQRKLMYFPSTRAVALPAGSRYAGIEDVTLTASDGARLKAWYWPNRRPETLLIFHGNAGDRGDRLSFMETLRETGAAVFILDYRGFGGSDGSPSEDGLYRDAEAAEAWLRGRGAGPLVYVGESLGTGVAVELALRRPPAALVLQSPFTSAVDVAKDAYPFLPVGLLLRDRYDNLSKVERLTSPVLVIHGERDSIIAIAHGKRVYDRITARKEWYPIPGGDHNDPLWEMDPAYPTRLARFLRIEP